MEKNELRSVEWFQGETVTLDENKKPKKNPGKTVSGWFHKWEKTVSEYGSETHHAILEDENGKLHHRSSDSFRFTDRVTGNVKEEVEY